MQARRLGAGGTPEEVRTLTDLGSGADLAIDSQGRATVVWTRPYPRRPFTGTGVVQAARIDADGNPGQVLTLSPGDGSPPALDLEFDRRQKLKDKEVLIRASCDEVCDVAADGRITIKRGKRGRARAKRFELRPDFGTTYCVHLGLPCYPRPKLHLTMSRKTRVAARRALRRDRRVVAKVTVVATDTAGLVASDRATVKLTKRPKR